MVDLYKCMIYHVGCRRTGNPRGQDTWLIFLRIYQRILCSWIFLRQINTINTFSCWHRPDILTFISVSLVAALKTLSQFVYRFHPMTYAGFFSSLPSWAPESASNLDKQRSSYPPLPLMHVWSYRELMTYSHLCSRERDQPCLVAP